MSRTGHAIIPHYGVKMRSLTGTISGNGIGAVLLDGGQGGQSSYHGIDDYIETTNRKPYNMKSVSGNGLADRISSKLSKLNIAPPVVKSKLKNIQLSM